MFWGLVRTPIEKRDMVALQKDADAEAVQWRVVEAQLAARRFIEGDDFTLADIGARRLCAALGPGRGRDKTRAAAYRALVRAVAARPGFAEFVAVPMSVTRASRNRSFLALARPNKKFAGRCRITSLPLVLGRQTTGAGGVGVLQHGELVFGMSASLDGYVDHTEMQTGPAVFRHWIEHVRGLAGSVYGRRMYETMRVLGRRTGSE